MQRSVSTTAPLLFYHFSKISKLLSFSVRDQHSAFHSSNAVSCLKSVFQTLLYLKWMLCTAAPWGLPSPTYSIVRNSHFTLQREKWCPGALLVKLQDRKRSKAKEISQCSFLSVLLVLLNSTCMFLTLEHNVSRVWESWGNICLSLCLRLFR